MLYYLIMLSASIEDYILTELTKDPDRTGRTLHRLKREASRLFGQADLVGNGRLITRYRDLVEQGRLSHDQEFENYLKINEIRSISGVATVTVLTKAFPCPGKCTYCPTEQNVPKSYLSNEPAVLRAIRNDYDPFRQVTARLNALNSTGHPTDKIELIIKGGTWSAYPEDYQTWFIQRCFDAANRCDSASIDEAHRRNETSEQRMIGVTIETRPDWLTVDEVIRLRRLGVTRVELGVQTLEAHILERINRGHDTRAVADAFRMLKQAGVKVAAHVMPGLPGATPDSDCATVRELFDNPDYRPDTMKIYPCVVVDNAEIYRDWQAGRYAPYDEDTLIDFMMRVKPHIPGYVRIERIIRDIPSPSIAAGCKSTNLRQIIQQRLAGRPWICRCIRCREPRNRPLSGELVMRRHDYAASSGREIFLSMENASGDILYAFTRLRLSDQHAPLLPELRNAALIRELHTYGTVVPLDQRNGAASQHRGLGRRLMEEAERIARLESCATRMAVIAGVGVREYYRKLGYALDGTYMVKELR